MNLRTDNLLARLNRIGPSVIAWRDACAAEMAALFMDPALPVAEQLERYVRLTGPKRPNNRATIMDQVVGKLREAGHDLGRSDVFGEDGAVNTELVRRLVPGFDAHYLQAAGIGSFDLHELIPETANRFAKFALPAPINKNMARERVPALTAYRTGACDLYVSAIGYQLFDAASGIYWSAASTRAYPQEAMDCPHAQIDKCVVMVQDIFEGTNFSHFLFDWITRLCQFLESGLEDPADCLFLMGGAPGEFHVHVVRAVCELYSLTEEQFVFPQERQVWHIGRAAWFFSDLRIDPMHPAHMGNPRSIAIMREIGSRLAAPAGDARRIYISRADAHMRRVTNEAEILAALRPFGIEPVVLAPVPFPQQLQLIRGADVIVAPHGMGLTHIAFHEGSPLILELHNPTIGTDAYAFVAHARGFGYRAVFGADEGQPNQQYSVPAVSVVDALLNEGVGLVRPGGSG